MNQLERGVDIMAWLKDYTTEAVDPIAAATIKYVRETLGVKRVGAVGYCFGAKVGFVLCFPLFLGCYVDMDWLMLETGAFTFDNLLYCMYSTLPDS